MLFVEANCRALVEYLNVVDVSTILTFKKYWSVKLNTSPREATSRFTHSVAKYTRGLHLPAPRRPLRGAISMTRSLCDAHGDAAMASGKKSALLSSLADYGDDSEPDSGSESEETGML